jgi:phospholipid/cholesterol/gamma-HCH transport system permease protein
VDAAYRIEPGSSGELLLVLAGDWRTGSPLPALQPLLQRIGAESPEPALSFDCRAVSGWDSALPAFLLPLLEQCEERGLAVDRGGLPDGVAQLLRLAQAVPERDVVAPVSPPPPLARIGLAARALAADARELLAFVGEAFLSLLRLFAGRARFRRQDLGVMLYDAGPRALPIVSLISLLVGLILAFVGAVQLRMFGAQIYVADLVGLGMAREMGAMMTAIILAGRTGAAYAAQLGTMQVNEEIDALRTLGIAPIDFLVLPRMLALVLMTPLLVLYADFMGIFGGLLVGVGMLDLSFSAYLQETREAVSLTDFAGGLFKGLVFGVLVALAGCLRGLQSGRSSAAVGRAATSAVVTGIVWIVVADAILTLIYDRLQI